MTIRTDIAPRKAGTATTDGDLVTQHLRGSAIALDALGRESDRLCRWGNRLAERLQSGARLLAAGNGGSAAEAQHLTAEIVGRFDGERTPFSAIALHADASSVTAIANDYGYDAVFARQVQAHGRPGDILLLLSTSGRSANLLCAADAARAAGVETWAITGRGPNPLSRACDETIALDVPAPHAQEAHLTAIHALCRVFDARVHADEAARR